MSITALPAPTRLAMSATTDRPCTAGGKPDVRDRVLAAIDRIAKGIATAAGIPAERAPIVEVLHDQFATATYNNPDMTRRFVAVWKKELGADNVDASGSLPRFHQ